MSPSWCSTIVSVLVVAVAPACSKSDKGSGGRPAAKTADAAPTKPEPKPKPSGFGAVTGTVTLVGTPPEMTAQNRKSDPVCAAHPKNTPYIVVGAGGALADVVVRLPPGTLKTRPPSTPLTVRQKDCSYVPYVSAIVAGQAIEIINSDKTLHNVQTWSGDTSLFNRAQPPGSGALRKTFDVKAGDVLKLGCNVHTWMSAHVVVTDHDKFAVTTKTGAFKLDRVPAGRHRLEAWHPHFPPQTIDVTVKKAATTNVDIRFEAKRYVAPR